MAFLGSAVNRVGWACFGGGGTGSWIIDIGVWWCTICEVVQNALVGIRAIVGSRGSRAAEAAEL